MGELTSEHPKCMTELRGGETILSRQLTILRSAGIVDVIMTTGYFDRILVDYCASLGLDLRFVFVNNPLYETTNYIYSIHLAREHLDDDILSLHGDLVFEADVVRKLLEQPESRMTVSTTLPLPPKDFKAVLRDGFVRKVGVEFFENAVAAQPLYSLKRADWKLWLDGIERFCEEGRTDVYAENVFNEISGICRIHPLDVGDMLCAEVDTPEDLAMIRERLDRPTERKEAYIQ